MLDLDSVVYSDKPFTLRERILEYRWTNGDWDALASLILLRTNLTNTEALDLTEEEDGTLVQVMRRINDMAQAGALARMTWKDAIPEGLFNASE